MAFLFGVVSFLMLTMTILKIFPPAQDKEHRELLKATTVAGKVIV